MPEYRFFDVRPYELMCTVCRLAAAREQKYHDQDRLSEILQSVRAQPSRPVRLCCNVSSPYSYQNPGTEHDTPEGELFNRRRDLTILQKLGLVPGDTRPALELISRFYEKIASTDGICRFQTVTSRNWSGCAIAASGNYERAHAMGPTALIPDRAQTDRTESKSSSCAAIYAAKELLIRPHHLICMTCFHGGKESLSPIAEDNLFEAIDVIQKNPDIPVRLIQGCCMICPPCSKYDPATGWCLGRNGMALRDEKKDLDTLQLLGLKYGDVLPARSILELLYERVESTTQVCGYGDGRTYGHEWTVCGGADGSPAYLRGRAAGMGVVTRRSPSSLS